MRWRQAPGGWQVVEWIADRGVASRARAAGLPRDHRQRRSAATEAFRRQLNTPLDAWMAHARLGADARLERPPRRLGRRRRRRRARRPLRRAAGRACPTGCSAPSGDGTFEDATERAGLGVLDDTAQSLFADVDNDGDQDLVLATGTQPLLFVNDGKGRFTPRRRTRSASTQPLQGVAHRRVDGRLRSRRLPRSLSVRLLATSSAPARTRPARRCRTTTRGTARPGVLFHNDGHGRFVDATTATRASTPATIATTSPRRGPTTTRTAGPTCSSPTTSASRTSTATSARAAARCASRTSRRRPASLDYGAGMSAAFLDYDNDGHLDIYTGNMWTAAGQRVTASPAFMPDAPPEIRATLSPARPRQLAVPQPRRRHVRGRHARRPRAEIGRWAWSLRRARLRQRRLGRSLRRQRHVRRASRSPIWTGSSGGRWWRSRRSTPVKGTPYDEAWRAINQLLIHQSIAQPPAQRAAAQRRPGRLRRGLRHAPASTSIRTAARSRCSTSIATAIRTSRSWRRARRRSCACSATTSAPRGAWFSLRLTRHGQSNRDAIGARVVVETDTLTQDEDRAGRAPASSRSTRRSCCSALGPSERIRDADGPVARRRQCSGSPTSRCAADMRLVEGGRLEDEPVAAAPRAADAAGGATVTGRPAGRHLALRAVPRARLLAPDLDGETRSLAALAGKPALLLFWTAADPAGRAARRRPRPRPGRAQPRRRRADRDRARSRRRARARAAGGAGARPAACRSSPRRRISR